MNMGTNIFGSRKVRLVTPVTCHSYPTTVPKFHAFLVDKADAPYDYYRVPALR